MIDYLFSAKWLLLPVAVFCGLLIFVHRIMEDSTIRRLGGYAPKRTGWIPLGFDFTWTTVKRNLSHQDLRNWVEFFRDYGNPANPYTIEARVCGQRIIFTADPENIKAVLATQFSDFGKGLQFNKEWHDFLGDSIFTTDGAQWHDSRQLLRSQFMKDRISDLETFEKHIDVLFHQIPREGEAVDVKDLFFRYTLDAITDWLLGHSVNSLENPQNEMTKAFADLQHVQSIISRTGPFNRFIPRAQFRRNIKVVEGFIEPFIDRTLALTPDELASRTKSTGGYTFLHALALFTRDRAVLRDQLMAVLLAGRDTTACSMSWLFYELSRRPDAVRRLRAEVADTVGWTRAPTYADLKGMRYLQHCLNETLRLYPVVPYNVRVSLKDTSLPSGGGADGRSPVGIAEGTPVGYSTHVLHLLPGNYPASPPHPDPLTWEPDRWDNWTPKSWTYIPFNGGPRICVGQQFALTEMGYTVTRMLQRFARVESRADGAAFEGTMGVRDQWQLWRGRDAARAEKGPGGMGTKAEIVLVPSKEVRVAFFKDE